VKLSPIATRKLAELAAQGYVTNGVAIFNPATGHRGLVDNLGFVGWMGAHEIDLAQVQRYEPIGSWDGMGMSSRENGGWVKLSDVAILIGQRDAGPGWTVGERIPVQFRISGRSGDDRTNRWAVVCGACGREFNPRTTRLSRQEFDCPKCGALHRADWNNDDVFHIKED